MTAKPAGRVLVGLPPELGNQVRDRARESYRTVSKEAAMLIERGIAAEKAAPGQP